MILRGSDSSDLAAESFHRDLTEQKLISMNDKKMECRKSSLFHYNYYHYFSFTIGKRKIILLLSLFIVFPNCTLRESKIGNGNSAI
jgi:hypothetical protein